MGWTEEARQSPQKPGTGGKKKKKKKRSQGLNLAFVQGGLHHRFQKTIFFFSQIPAGGIYSVIFNGHLFSYLKVYEISVTPQS